MPENAIATQRMPAAAFVERLPFAHEREREDEHAGHGEEQRRVGELAAARLDAQVLARDEPRGAEDADHVHASCERAAVALAQRSAAGRHRAQRPSSQADRAIDERVGALEVVRRHEDDRAALASARSRADQQPPPTRRRGR